MDKVSLAWLHGWNETRTFFEHPDKGKELPEKKVESIEEVTFGGDQRHVLRDGQPNTAACSACWAIETKAF
jgi:hypothetical protein